MRQSKEGRATSQPAHEVGGLVSPHLDTSMEFSLHSDTSIAQRTFLGVHAVAELISSGRVIDIGQEIGSDRHHLLFYSCQDVEHFVAIYDTKTRTVVTLLTADMHANVAWRVREQDRNRALEMALGIATESREPQSISKMVAKRDLKLFEVEVRFKNEVGKLTKLSIGNFSERSFDELVKSAAIHKQIRQRINNLTAQGCSDFKIGARLKKGEPLELFPAEIVASITKSLRT